MFKVSKPIYLLYLIYFLAKFEIRVLKCLLYTYSFFFIELQHFSQKVEFLRRKLVRKTINLFIMFDLSDLSMESPKNHLFSCYPLRLLNISTDGKRGSLNYKCHIHNFIWLSHWYFKSLERYNL